MKRTGLRHELFCAFKDTVTAPGELIMARGKELRREYEDCVRRYRRIVEVAGSRPGNEGSRVSDRINLGTEELPQIGRVIGSAVVRFCPFQSAGSGPTARPPKPFSVEVAFSGRDEHGRERHGSVELFGGGNSFFGIRPPAFIRNPGTTMEEPYGDESGWYHYRGGREYPWDDDDNYRKVASRLLPMIEAATDTQTLLITALQDETLNPQYAATARVELTAPQNHPLAA